MGPEPRPTKEATAELVGRARSEHGSVTTTARCLLSLLSLEDPTPEQDAGVTLIACAMLDLQAIARRQRTEAS